MKRSMMSALPRIFGGGLCPQRSSIARRTMRARPAAEPLEGRLLMTVLDILEPQAGAISAQADITQSSLSDHKTAVLGDGSSDYTNPPLVKVSVDSAATGDGPLNIQTAQATLKSTNAGNSRSIILGTSTSSIVGISNAASTGAEASIGTNQFGNPDDSGIAITVQIEPSEGEQEGQPVRIDLIGAASGTVIDGDTSYQISYQTQNGLSDLLKGDSSAYNGVANKSDSNSASFTEAIGESFNLVLKLSSRTFQNIARADGTLQLNMSGTVLPGGPTVPGQPAATPPKLVQAQAMRAAKSQDVIVLTFDQALDPARAQNPANYTVAEITTQGKGKHARERLKAVRVVSATYDPQAHTVTLRFAGTHPFQKGAQIIVHAGAPGAADGITNEQGVHLAGDGVHEGTDATVRVA
jgi:hypothetical protein